MLEIDLTEDELRAVMNDELFKFFHSKDFARFYGNIVRVKLEEMVKEKEEEEFVEDNTSIYDTSFVEPTKIECDEEIGDEFTDDEGYVNAHLLKYESCPSCSAKRLAISERQCNSCGTSIKYKKRSIE